MARLVAVALIYLVVFGDFVSNAEGRRLLVSSNTQKKINEGRTSVPSFFPSLILSALPKGTVTPSSPSKKVHATLDNKQLFARHLASIDRILRSVPSPGVGH